MLKHLSIQNFAVIESIVIDFEEGLNIIIGETGAGKSIIIDSLSILLGEKALTSYIREGAKKSVIEGVFSLSAENPVWDILKNNDIDLIESDENSNENLQLIIRREISLSGNSRIFINDSPAQFSTLKNIGDSIIDFHGQFDHQSLINPANHIHILDAFCSNFELLKNYQNELNKLKKLISNFREFLTNLKLIKIEFEQKKRTLEEISEINPQINEDTELAGELKLLENSETVHNLLLEMNSLLGNEEFSFVNNLITLKKKLESISKFDSKFSSYSTEVDLQIPFFNDLTNFVSNYLESFAFDPERIESINQRLFILQQLKRKFGTLEEINELKQSLEEFVNSYSDIGKAESNLHNEIINQYKVCLKIAKELSDSRKNNKSKFESQIALLLNDLGFSFVKFEIKLNSLSETELIFNPKTDELNLSNNGIDKCEFYISTNLGESTKELARIASGGELSRIMLSLKTMAASDKNLPILVFDEIDSGVSGRIAQKVGEMMRQFSLTHQIICITHSPQVTAAGNCIISIEKIESDKRTISVSRKLSEEESTIEIAKFLSGTIVSDTAIESARALRKNYKN